MVVFMKLSKAAFFTTALMLLFGCVTQVQKSQSNSNLSYGMVKSNIIKGQTTQAEVMQMFGAPNLVTKNKSDNEVWNYNRMAFERVDGMDAGAAIFWAGAKAVTVSTTKSFDLIIIFDNNDIVKDYSVIQASF